MFDVMAVQSVVQQVLINISLVIGGAVIGFFGILAAVIGINIAIGWVRRYIAGGDSFSMGDYMRRRYKKEPHTWMDGVNTTGRDVTGRKHYEGDID